MKDDRSLRGLETSSTVNAVSSLPRSGDLVDSFLAISRANSTAFKECSEPSIATKIFDIVRSLCCCWASNVNQPYIMISIFMVIRSDLQVHYFVPSNGCLNEAGG